MTESMTMWHNGVMTESMTVAHRSDGDDRIYGNDAHRGDDDRIHDYVAHWNDGRTVNP